MGSWQTVGLCIGRTPAGAQSQLTSPYLGGTPHLMIVKYSRILKLKYTFYKPLCSLKHGTEQLEIRITYILFHHAF